MLNPNNTRKEQIIKMVEQLILKIFPSKINFVQRNHIKKKKKINL